MWLREAIGGMGRGEVGSCAREEGGDWVGHFSFGACVVYGSPFLVLWFNDMARWRNRSRKNERDAGFVNQMLGFLFGWLSTIFFFFPPLSRRRRFIEVHVSLPRTYLI